MITTDAARHSLAKLAVQLSDIADLHEPATNGMYAGHCRECHHAHPCRTFRLAMSAAHRPDVLESQQ